MTEPALMWRRFDATASPPTCSYAGCGDAPAYTCGPRTPLLRLPWRSYCRAHAMLYGLRARRQIA